MLVATFSAQGAGGSLAMRLVDVAHASELASARAPVGDRFTVRDVDAVLTALDAPAARATQLEVRGPAGAALVVDGEPSGTLPATLTELSPGKHGVTVGSFEASVEVHPGERPVVDVPATAVPSTSADPPALKEAARAPGRPAPAAADTTPLGFYAVGGGAGAGALGAVAVMVGLVPLLTAQSAAANLAQLEGAARSDASSADANRAAIASAHRVAEENLAAWHAWGLPLTAVGVLTASAGFVAAGVGLVVWE